MKLPFIILILTLSVFTQAQPKPQLKTIKPCNLTMDKAPKLRGFYLGQNKKDLDIIPYFSKEYASHSNNDVVDKGRFGFVLLHSSDLFYQTPGNRIVSDSVYEDIEFFLHFLDHKIMFVSIQYTEYEPSNLTEFIKQVSETTNLPIESWKIVDKFNAEMKCNDFDVYVGTGKVVGRPVYEGYPSLTLTDKNAAMELERRVKEYNASVLAAEREQKRLEKERKREEERKRKIFKP